MIFGTGGRLRRSEQDPFEGLVRLAEDFKRRRKPSGTKSGSGGKPLPRKRVSEKRSVGRARASAKSRPLAPQPGGSDGVSGNGRPPGGQPPPAPTQHGHSSAVVSSSFPELREPHVLTSRHLEDGVISGRQLCPISEDCPNAPPSVFTPQSIAPTGNFSTTNGTLAPEYWNGGGLDSLQLYPVPGNTPNAVPPLVSHPQTITPTGRPFTDKDTDWMDLDFLVSGKRQTFHGLYTRLEYHSTVSPRLASLSKHGIQRRPPSAGPGKQAIMTLCTPVCIPNVSRGCKEKDVVMEVDEFLGKADFCVGVGVLEKIKAIQAGLDLDVGSGDGPLFTGDLTPMMGMNTPAPTSSYGNGQDTIHAHGIEQISPLPQPAQPIVSPTLGHGYTLFPGPINSGEGAAVSPGETYAQPQVSVPSMRAASYVDTSAPDALDPMYGAGIGVASDYFFQGEEFDPLAWELLRGV